MSEEAMRERDPSGWTHFLGNEDNFDGVPQGLGGFFLTTMERQQLKFVEFMQNEAERQQEDELKAYCKVENNVGEDEEVESRSDKLQAWRELHKIKFISGNDPGFDYSVVDDNDRYDNVKQQRLDDEEKWFDGDSE